MAKAPSAFDFMLPADAALTATIDLAKMSRADAAPLLSPLQSVLEDVTGLPHAASLHELFTGAGVDDQRPLSLAIFAVDADGQRAITTLSALVPEVEPEVPRKSDPSPPPVVGAIRAALAQVPSILSVRVVVPATDPTRVQAAIDLAMKSGGWKVDDKGQYSTSHAVAAATVGQGVLAFDFATGNDPAAGLSSLRASASKNHGDAPLLGDALMRLSYSPTQLADQSFLSGLTRMVMAVSGESIPNDMRERISAQGLWDSAQGVTLAKSKEGVRWNRVEISASLRGGHPAVSMRAEPGPGFVLPPADASTKTFSVATTNARYASPSFDASRAWLTAWKLPGGGAGGANGLTLTNAPFYRIVQNAGPLGKLVALPDLAVVAPALLDGHDESAPKPEVLARFTRFGITEGGSVFYGILPDGTTRANAECVLAGRAPCGARRLTLGTAGKDDDARVLLTQVDGHFVLLRTRNQNGLAVKLRATSLGPVHASLDLAGLPAPIAALLPFTAVLDARRDGDALVADIAFR